MPQITISRRHGLPRSEAHALALEWAQAAHHDFGVQFSPQPDAASAAYKEYHFKRSGLHGCLRVTDDEVFLALNLGFLLGNFKDRIEATLLKNLDARLARFSTGSDDAPVAPAHTPPLP